MLNQFNLELIHVATCELHTTLRAYPQRFQSTNFGGGGHRALHELHDELAGHLGALTLSLLASNLQLCIYIYIYIHIYIMYIYIYIYIHT